jgi:hypothetical protein
LEEKANKPDDIEELLSLIEDKIGNDRTNDGVFAQLGHDMMLPHVDLSGGANDANEGETTQFRANADEYTPEAFDNYLNAQIVTNRGGDVLCGTVESQNRDSDRKPIGFSDQNPILNTREYLVCFEDGTEDTYKANLIAECIYSQINEKG